jgi:hypothetical protein
LTTSRLYHHLLRHLIFDYNRRTRRFELANRRFAKYLIKGATERIARTKESRNSDPSQHSVEAFGIFLDFIYSGQQERGWNYYREEKTASKLRQSFQKDSTIRKALSADPAYRAIYRE